MVNLVEWACALNPTTSNVLSTPATRVGNTIEYIYPRSLAAVNASTIFTVEWSDTLLPGSWSNAGVTETILSDNGTVQQVKALVPAGAGAQRFVYSSVTLPP